MESVTRIFLTGMPGAGKTFWGEKVATAYQMHFTDLDQYISEKEHADIPTLFARYEESGFRELEHKYLEEIIDTAAAPTIVACGGGTPCFLNNMDLMKRSGCVVYLQCGTDTLVRHIQHGNDSRPLLRNKPDLNAYLTGLLKMRERFYLEADHILHIKDISLATFEQIISSCTNKE